MARNHSTHRSPGLGAVIGRWWRRVGRALRLPGFVHVPSANLDIEAPQYQRANGLDVVSAVGWPSVASPAAIETPVLKAPEPSSEPAPESMAEPLPDPPSDEAGASDAQPSTADEDETVHKDGTFGVDYAVGVSRETYEPRTLVGGGGLLERADFGFSLPTFGVQLPVDQPAPILTPGGTPTVPGPRAMAGAADPTDPSGAVYEASGGPNTIVSAAGHRGGRSAEIDGVRQAKEPEDPPLAQEAKRAVQILNPSGEIQMPRPPKTRVFCVSNQKGGVGKTTSVVNIAVALALHGNRVLVIDLDPQGNASTGLDVPHHSAIPDVYDCLVTETPMEEVVQAVSGIPNLWCVPATIDLAGAEIELVSMVARESRLLRALEAHGGAYDYVFIDCPPSLGLLTVNALVAAQEVMIPIQCEYYALEGVQQLTNNIQLVKNHLNPQLDVTTVLLTMYDRRTRLADAVEQDVRAHFGDRVLTAVIPRNVRVSEAPSYGQSVMTYDPGSRGATSYFEAALEIATRGSHVGGA
jgi:chromosome partitioning protein